MTKTLIIIALILAIVVVVNMFLSWGPVMTMFIPLILSKLFLEDC